MRLRKTLHDHWGFQGRLARIPTATLPLPCGQQACLKSPQTSFKTRLKYHLAISWLFRDNALCSWLTRVFSYLFLFPLSAFGRTVALLHYCSRADWEKISRWGLGILGLSHSALSEHPAKCRRLSGLRAPQVTKTADNSRGGSGEDRGLEQTGRWPGTSAGSSLRLLMQEMSLEGEGSSVVTVYACTPRCGESRALRTEG